MHAWNNKYIYQHEIALIDNHKQQVQLTDKYDNLLTKLGERRMNVNFHSKLISRLCKCRLTRHHSEIGTTSPFSRSYAGRMLIHFESICNIKNILLLTSSILSKAVELCYSIFIDTIWF